MSSTFQTRVEKCWHSIQWNEEKTGKNKKKRLLTLLSVKKDFGWWSNKIIVGVLIEKFSPYVNVVAKKVPT